MRQVYVNGQFVPESEAKISVFDRGFLFGDAVYEVTLVLDGKLCDFPSHLRRLRRSLGELGMNFTRSDDELLAIHRESITRNALEEGLIYLQVTRGEQDRDFAFPPEGTPNTLVLFPQKKAVIANALAARGQTVVSVDDLRWRRCDIKTVQLLYSALAKMEAKKRHVDDAWLVRDGFVTEGTSYNAFIVTRAGEIVTRALSHDILPGVTRASVIHFAEEANFKIVERPFTIAEGQAAAEAFTTSATSIVVPVTAIDGQRIGDGKPGPVAKQLREIYIAKARLSAI